MRRTAKFVQACITARSIGVARPDSIPHDELYQALEAAAFAWSAKRQKWEEQKRPVTTSMFGSASEGSGIFRVRLMAHPTQIDGFVADTVEAYQAGGYTIDEVSDHYANRRGVGTRVYVTMTRVTP